MALYKDIETEFITIDPLDSSRLNVFYDKHKAYFDNISQFDKETEIKRLTMLIEIACSNSFANNHTIALDISNSIKTQLKPELIPSLSDKINNLHFSTALSLLALKKHSEALVYLKAYTPNIEEKHKIDILIKRCQYRKIDQILLGGALLGALILAIQFVSLRFFPTYYSPTLAKYSWACAVLLLCYGLFQFHLRKKTNI